MKKIITLSLCLLLFTGAFAADTTTDFDLEITPCFKKKKKKKKTIYDEVEKVKTENEDLLKRAQFILDKEMGVRNKGPKHLEWTTTFAQAKISLKTILQQIPKEKWASLKYLETFNKLPDREKPVQKKEKKKRRRSLVSPVLTEPNKIAVITEQ